jgi:hypothetical protein
LGLLRQPFKPPAFLGAEVTRCQDISAMVKNSLLAAYQKRGRGVHSLKDDFKTSASRFPDRRPVGQGTGRRQQFS